jgi:release factor glutamine methyltransferase
MAEAFEDLDGTVDLVIANPPYVPLEHWADVPAEVRDHDPWLALGLGGGRPGRHARRGGGGDAGCCARAGSCAPSTPRCRSDERTGGLRADRPVHARDHDHRDLTERPRFVTAVRAGRMGE